MRGKTRGECHRKPSAKWETFRVSETLKVSEMAGALKKYAFQKMGLQRLIALIEPENEGSERVAVKVGMHLEKEVVRPGGEVRRVYAIETEAENQVACPAALT